MFEKLRNFTFILFCTAIFLLATGCTPGKSQLKDNNRVSRNDRYDSENRHGRNNNYNGNENVESNKFENSGNNEDFKFEDESVKSGMNNRSGNDDNSRNRYSRNEKNSEKMKDSHRNEEFSNNNEDSNENLLNNDRYYETGFASWYGREFHGKVTSSGERFDMNDYTAAHKKLPFGTIVEIKNFDNGRSVRVKINDRGPYRGNRVIDLSYASAKRLGMISGGKAMVGITVIRNGKRKAFMSRDRYRRNKNVEPVVNDKYDRDDRYSDDNNETSDFSVQAGAFYSKRNAENLKSQLEELTKNPVVLIRENELYKVRIKGITNRKEAKRFKRVLSEESIKSYIINNRE